MTNELIYDRMNTLYNTFRYVRVCGILPKEPYINVNVNKVHNVKPLSWQMTTCSSGGSSKMSCIKEMESCHSSSECCPIL